MPAKQHASSISVLDTETTLINHIWGDKYRQIHYTIENVSDLKIILRVYTGVDVITPAPLLTNNIDYPDDDIWVRVGPTYCLYGKKTMNIVVKQVQSQIKITGEIISAEQVSTFDATSFNSASDGLLNIWVTNAL